MFADVFYFGYVVVSMTLSLYVCRCRCMDAVVVCINAAVCMYFSLYVCRCMYVVVGVFMPFPLHL